MKFFEKFIILIAIIAGVVGVVLILTLTLGRGETGEKLALAAYRAPAQDQALVVALSGDVFRYRGERWEPVTVGELVTADDYLKTFENASLDLQIGSRILFTLREKTVIKMGEILGSGEALVSDTELFTGTLLCKVKRLAGEDRVRVRTGTKAFGVRGTVFLLERKTGQVLVAVGEGRVAVSDAESGRTDMTVPAGRELTLDEEAGRLGQLRGLPAERQSLLSALQAVSLLDTQTEDETGLVKIALEVNPRSAEILIDGTPVGVGSFGGIFRAGTELPVVLRKPGYLEQRFTLPVHRGEHRVYLFKLELAGPDSGFNNEDETYRLDQRIEQLETALEAVKREQTVLENQLSEVRARNRELEQELEEARTRIKSALDELQ
ncbi:MAG TPA: hypothetical protein ENN69_06550 [Spirochaetia bacterium]|nr:hypothetical protein [Spirochaetia bacterium]